MEKAWQQVNFVVEFANRIFPALEQEIGKSFHKILEKQGFKFMLSTKVIKTKKNQVRLL